MSNLACGYIQLFKIHANVLKTYKEDGAVSSSTGPGVMFRAQFVDALCTVACHIATERVCAILLLLIVSTVFSLPRRICTT